VDRLLLHGGGDGVLVVLDLHDGIARLAEAVRSRGRVDLDRRDAGGDRLRSVGALGARAP
jgi:hypothetical protein